MKLKTMQSDLFNHTSTANLSNAYDVFREQADHQRREQRRHGGANPEVQDRRFGFDESRDNAHQKDKGRGGRISASNDRGHQATGLYSDAMMVDTPVAPSRGGSRRGRGRR